MYTEKVMDHFQHPRNMGEIENASGVGTVGNAKCGDIMRIYLDIDDNGIINDVKFKTFGCGAAVATSSMATELLVQFLLLLRYPNKLIYSSFCPSFFTSLFISTRVFIIILSTVCAMLSLTFFQTYFVIQLPWISQLSSE